MNEKRPQPKQDNYSDLEQRHIFIPSGAIKSFMLDPSILLRNDGSETGRYGQGKYGRCKYGKAGPTAIYGYDTYGNAIYG